MEWFGLVLLALLLSTNWNALEGKRYAKSIHDQLAGKHEERPKQVIACPYGYGNCEAFPLGAKPCKGQPGFFDSFARRLEVVSTYDFYDYDKDAGDVRAS